MTWINEPSSWTADGDTLAFSVTGETDLWRQTHYGYTYDTAPMYGRTVEGDAKVRVTFTADYAEQYDQAGAILRADENNWIKAGVEFVDGDVQISAVVTRDFSDWSVMRAPEGTTSVTFELVREGDSVHIYWGVNGGDPVTLLRLAYFPPGVPALAGAMAAAPVGKGFQVDFSEVVITG
ncbi:DUF1349 domain-containing protein [Herbidospora daliensis]|uniref:DUF1349 domain-containing protein n=1 Tax=Herbidospora daliensis TaxID=295585 RepID=UPI000780611F|nr:DUF1349 domain-containing protein [Herbidospora daliensis]